MSMETITKRDLVERVTSRVNGTTKSVTLEVIQGFLDEVAAAVAEGHRIELRDFGVFSPRDRKPRTARNPKTGESVFVPATRTVAFKVGKEFKQKLMPTNGTGA